MKTIPNVSHSFPRVGSRLRIKHDLDIFNYVVVKHIADCEQRANCKQNLRCHYCLHLVTAEGQSTGQHCFKDGRGYPYWDIVEY